MKPSRSSKGFWLAQRRGILLRLVGVITLLALAAVSFGAEESREESSEGEKPEPLTQEQMFEGGDTTYTNWIELSVGGFIPNGNEAQAQQMQQLSEGAFGGIEDLHFQHDIAKSTTLTLDGHGIYDNHDYSLGLEVKHEETWFFRLNFENFRTWYNDDGGYYPPTGVQYTLFNDALALDRGEVSFEAGLALKDKPSFTFKYTHWYRDGDKSSTSWGLTHPEYGIPGGNPTLVRGLTPSFYDIDETRDTFELDAKHHIKATDLGLGLTYEIGDLNDAKNTVQFPGEPTQRAITDRQGTSYDMFSAHAFTETWIKKNVFLSTGFLYANQWGDTSGNRIYGDDFDVKYSPNSLNGLGYTNLMGDFCQQEYVLNLNLMTIPVKKLTITPSLRVQKTVWNNDSAGWQTLGDDPATYASSESDRDLLEVQERLDIHYSGVTNWIFYARGEWTEGDGNLKETGGMGITPPIQRNTDDSHFLQKYSLGARWYPARWLTIDAGGYYKSSDYDYDHLLDSTTNFANRYPAYLVMQNFDTYDGNVRLTLRPRHNITLVGRYEYQFSTVHTKPGQSYLLPEVESSEMTSHILALNATWIPWSRLYLQAGGNYVLSETKTPSSNPTFTQTILDAQNNYWTVNANAGFVVDDRTDLNVGYFYYRADNYDANYTQGVSLGAGAEEHGITATISRRISRNMRLMLRYAHYCYTDETYGGNTDYDAHVLFSSLQYRF